jgi:3-oxoacyl-[acyl-carrier-protein] synthase III
LNPLPEKSTILGLGAAVPTKILTNHDLEKMVDTSDEWIRTRTGIEKRHIAEDGTTTKTLAVDAAREAIADAGLTANDIDLVILGTLTPDIGFPATACLIQHDLGAENAAAFDLNAACSGFIYGLQVADALVRAGAHRHVLVIGAETLSRIVNWEDRNTCVLFGDGAGAAVIGLSPDSEHGIIDTMIYCDGEEPELLCRKGGGTLPVSKPEDHFISMEGGGVFKRAVTAMGNASMQILKNSGYSGNDVDLLVTHQANIRIIEATAKRVKLPMDKVYINVNEYGNTSAATIPLALAEAKRDGKLQPGMLVVLAAFGAGFTWGSALVRI